MMADNTIPRRKVDKPNEPSTIDILGIAIGKPKLGDVAQLVERLHGMQEVVGSIPFVSIYRKRRW